MRIDELILELRQDFLEDDVVPYKWSDSKVLRYFNEAILEACIRSPLLKATQTITVAMADATYTLDDNTRQIDTVNLALQPTPLVQMTDDSLSAYYGANWRETTGTPLAFMRKELEITLYPEPIVADTMTVLSFRTPDKIMSTSQEPEIPENHHRHLIYWAAYKAFLNPDVDLGRPDRALSFLGLFEAHFGKRKTAMQEHINMNTPKYNSVLPRRMA